MYMDILSAYTIYITACASFSYSTTQSKCVHCAHGVQTRETDPSNWSYGCYELLSMCVINKMSGLCKYPKYFFCAEPSL